MPRKIFIQDLKVAATLNIQGISSVQPGEDDGTISLVYTPPSKINGKVSIQAMAPGWYPFHHDCNC
jgi:hypothetical protein